MFKLAVIHALYGVKTKWKDRRIQPSIVIWIIIIVANSLAWFEKDSIAWFWTTYGFLFLAMTMFAIDENVYPEVFRFLPITQAKKKSYLLHRAILESIVHVLMITTMLIVYYVVSDKTDMVILVEAFAFFAFAIKRFGQNWHQGFCKIAGLKHIYECNPEDKASKRLYWMFVVLDIIAFICILFGAVFMNNLITKIVAWRICGVTLIYCVVSSMWDVQTMRKCMNQIEW